MHPILQDLSNRWRIWKQGSTNKKIFSAALTIIILSLIVKLSAIVKDLLVANQFGTNDALDAFIIAFLLPSFFLNIISGSIKAALIPVYVNITETQSPEDAKKLLSSILCLTICLLMLASILLVWSAPYILKILASGFEEDKLALTESLLYILLPILIIGSLSSILGAIINTREHFVVVAFSPIVIQLLIIASLLFFTDAWGIYALAVGTTFGFVLELFWIIINIKRVRIIILPRWFGLNVSTKKVINQFLPMATGAILMSSTELVDQGMAAMLDSGSVSTLNYSNKLTSLITGLGSIALGTAIFPYFSKQAAIKDWRAVRHTFMVYMRFILLIMIPFTMVLIYFSYPLIELIFERGAFQPNDTLLISYTQTFYLLQIPFYIIGIMCARLLNALSKNKVLMKVGFVSLIINTSGNFILMKYLGVAGIALSTSIVYLISFVFFVYYINKLTRLENQ